MKLKNKLVSNPSVCYMRHMDKIPELLKAPAQNDCREHVEACVGDV